MVLTMQFPCVVMAGLVISFLVKTDQFEVFFLLGLQSHQLQVEVARVRSALPVQSHYRLFRRDLDHVDPHIHHLA